MKHGIVYRADGGMFPYCGWPTVCADENGTLYAAFSGNRAAHVCPFGKDLMCVSHDGGESWTAPMIINDTQLDDRDAGIVSLGDGKLLMSFFNHPRRFYTERRKTGKIFKHPMSDLAMAMTNGLFDEWEKIDESVEAEGVDRSGSYTRLSRDGGKTWEKAVQAPVTAPHGPIMLSDGSLLYFGKRMTEVNDSSFRITAAKSLDMGKSWEILGEVPLPEGYSWDQLFEPHAVELPSGRILGAIRAHVDSSRFASGITILLTHSDDGGKTWSTPFETEICGTPPHLLLHSSGAVILSYGRREVPYGERAMISYDGGESFTKEVVLDDMGPDWDLGYPSTAELSDGSLITVYYQKVQGDSYCSVLYTKWELPENS